jgi:hypothetical protein
MDDVLAKGRSSVVEVCTPAHNYTLIVQFKKRGNLGYVIVYLREIVP